MDALRQDLRYALRRLIKSPGFTMVSVLTLALGMGANSAIFSVANGILLKRLPYHEPDRLVALFHVEGKDRAPMSGPNFTDLRRMSRTLADAAAFTRSRAVLTGGGEPVRLAVAEVSANLFDVLGVTPVMGRSFRAEENEPGKTDVAVLSYGFWQERLGGRADAIGRDITLDGVRKRVIGVMPRGFSYPASRDLWLPLEHTENLLVKQRAAWFLTAVGRAQHGIPLEQVVAEVETIGKQLAREYADANEGVDFGAMSLHEATVGSIRTAVLVLLGAVGFVLLIACANVANLLLARAAAREGEMAVRTALGAGRGRLVRQLLTESVCLALLGGTLGLLLAVWGVEFLVALQPQDVPRLQEVRVDVVVALFTLALSIATGIVFGLVPAFSSTRGGLTGALKEGGRGALTGRAGARMRASLVVAEMAVALVLLAGAGLLIRSFVRLAAVDPGFRVEDALTFDVTLPDARYAAEPQQIGFFDRLMPRLRSIPGVEDAGAVLGLPLSGLSIVLTFEVAGRPPLPPAQQPAMQVRVATPEYFRVVGIPLRRGRLFSDRDREGAPPVVLLTEAAAAQYFPGEDPIGRTITLGWGRGPGKPLAGGAVVGIVGDVKDAGLHEADPPQIYLAYRQWPVQSMTVVLKTAVPPLSVTDAVRSEVRAVDPNMPVSNVRTLEQVLAMSISQPRFYTTLLSVFAGVALVLAAIGIFGVLSYAVAQRTREIGIRMALGAEASSVRRLITREAMVLSGGGVLAGVIGAYFLSEALGTLLFEISPGDPLTLATVAALLMVIALVASYVPARRATRVDPMIALRTE